MAKKNPFDIPLTPTKPPTKPPLRPDALIENADWPKRSRDIDAYTGQPVEPVAVKPTKG